MWIATLGRREFLEAAASGPSSDICKAVTRHELSSVVSPEAGKIIVGWAERPVDRQSFPLLAIAQEDQIRDLLAAVNSSPKAVTPFSAFCRIVSFEQANAYATNEPPPLAARLVDAIGMLSLAEVQLHSGGQIKVRQVGPAACRRTLSFAWAKAMSAGVPVAEIDRLTKRWLEAYEICSLGSPTDENGPPVHHVLPVLQAVVSLLEAGGHQSTVSQLIASIVTSDIAGRNAAWLDIAKNLQLALSLQDLERAPREERGAYLQQSFEAPTHTGSVSEREAAQGFLATQIAPGSLEHLELLMARSGPGAAFWYVLFASLQNPVAIMNAFGGLGRRISRDVRSDESLERMPRADIALEELKVLARFGTEDLSRKVGHSNEIEVELLPLVSATFRFNRNQAAKSSSRERAIERPSNYQLLSSLRQISAIIDRTMADLYNPAEDNPVTKPKRKKPHF